jgi:hypothetical protein
VFTAMRTLALVFLLVACAKKPDDFHVAGSVPVSVCAAYSYEPQQSGAVVIEPSGKTGEVVDYRGHQFNIHRSNCVTIAQPTIHWHVTDGIAFVGVGDSAELGARSEKRMSQYDAIYAGDALLWILLYEDVMRDTLWVGDSHRDDQVKRFVQLTGTQPPSAK